MSYLLYLCSTGPPHDGTRLKKIRGCSVCTAKVVMATVLATEVIGESPLII